ncbi:hypothetical protein [Companilactobacillus mishanensis]|uniref:Uncharacterized protein n=1 Tax=Companilactobacillus mishanensis TaxID=2486008 RepID=A0A5P0ZGL9_9LACO|nr:hypothetical protein [Companilactobacillus mishanensis]MQS52159.1 hypothetical protein [Companilactobacillus mishanensis]
MDKISDELVTITKTLEHQIPKGYHEIVLEYVRQNIVSLIVQSIILILILILLISGITYFTHCWRHPGNWLVTPEMDIETSRYGDKRHVDKQLTNDGVIYQLFGTIAIMISLAVIIILLAVMTSHIQHIVSPNYYLIKSFIK